MQGFLTDSRDNGKMQTTMHGLGVRDIISLIEIQTEKKMENEMATGGACRGLGAEGKAL